MRNTLIVITSVINYLENFEYKRDLFMQISHSEKILMDVLWRSASIENPLSAKAIILGINDEPDWHDKTVKTLLNRLLKKQAIGFHKQGRKYLYYPLLIKQNYVEVVADSFLKRVFDGSVASLVASLAKQEKLTAKDIAELKALLDEIEK